jgi:hypothetical protein
VLSGASRNSITAVIGSAANAAISVAAFSATSVSSTQNARELHGSSANQRSMPWVR